MEATFVIIATINVVKNGWKLVKKKKPSNTNVKRIQSFIDAHPKTFLWLNRLSNIASFGISLVPDE